MGSLTILSIILAVAAVVAFAAGARRGRAWGKPAVVVLTLLAVGSLVASIIAGGGAPTYRASADPSVELLGRGLKGEVEEGARVFVFYGALEGDIPDFTNRAAPSRIVRAWEQALSKGAGVQVRIVGTHQPYPDMLRYREHPPGAREFARALEASDIDAWVSLVGMPVDAKGHLTTVTPPPAEDGPAVAARMLQARYNRRQVGTLLRKGMLTAAVTNHGGQMQVITQHEAR